MRSSPSTRLSRSTLLKLGASSEHNLTFELDKQGNPLLLGKGGFGEVYKARWHGTLVAVKALVSDEAPKVAAFQHECNILESLHHTHVVHHFDSLIGEEGTVRLCCLSSRAQAQSLPSLEVYGPDKYKALPRGYDSEDISSCGLEWHHTHLQAVG